MALGHLWRRIVLALSARQRREAELDEEIRFHLESATEEYRRRGLSDEAARRAARLDFGAVDGTKEEVREAWALARLAAFGRDLRIALRGFRRRPAYAATVVVTLALAAGSATAIFNALWTVVVEPLPYRDDSQLVVLRWQQGAGAGSVGPSPVELRDYREQSRAFAGLVEQHTMSFTLLGHGEPRRVRTAVVSAGYFSLLGVRPVLGRDFVESDDSAEAQPVLLLSYRFWRNELGGDAALVGADFTMNDRIHTVVGVMPPLPATPDDIDVYMPVHACPFRSSPGWDQSRSARGLLAIARLRDGYALEQAQADTSLVAGRLAAEYPEAYPEGAQLRSEIVPLRQAITVDARPTLWLLASAAAFVLLLVVSNLANLSLAQYARRQAEFAVRATLGGDRARLAYQLGLESTLLALAGGALGVLFAAASQSLLARFLSRLTPRATEIALDSEVVLVALGLAVVLGLAVGLAPILGRQRPLTAALRSDGSTSVSGGRSPRVRDALVIVQVAASFVLLIGAGLLLRSLWNLEKVSPGFTHQQVVTMSLPNNWTKYDTDERQVAYAERILQRVAALPGIESVALADNYPLNSNQPWNRRIAVGEEAPDRSSAGPTADFRIVSPGYFETVGVPLVAGRGFEDHDRDPEHVVAIVNQALVRVLFPDRDPLGERVIFAGGNTTWTIIGVVADVRQRGLGEPAQPELFAPLALAGGGGLTLLVRSSAGLAMVPALREAIRSIDPEQPIIGVRTIADARAASLAGPRTAAALLAIAAVLALVIAAAGLAGLLAYTLGQRHREFGIRLALGATRSDIAQLVLGRTAWLVGLGAAVGIGGALVVTRSLDSMLFGLAAADPATYALVVSVLASAAILAAIPTLRRALATAPSLALRAI